MNYLLLYRMVNARGDRVNEWELFDSEQCARVCLERLKREGQGDVFSSAKLLSYCIVEAKVVVQP